jgi:hypothetical protein
MPRMHDLKDQLDGANERIVELEEEKAAAAEFRAIQPEALRLAQECRAFYEQMREPLGKRTAQKSTHLGQQLAALVALLSRGGVEAAPAMLPKRTAQASRGGARVFAIPEPRFDDEQGGSWANGTENPTGKRRKGQGRGK